MQLLFVLFLTKNIIILLFNSVFVRFLDINFLFFIIEWSAHPVISAFGINSGSSCLDQKNSHRQMTDSAEIWSPTWEGQISSEQLGDIGTKGYNHSSFFVFLWCFSYLELVSLWAIVWFWHWIFCFFVPFFPTHLHGFYHWKIFWKKYKNRHTHLFFLHLPLLIFCKAIRQEPAISIDQKLVQRLL